MTRNVMLRILVAVLVATTIVGVAIPASAVAPDDVRRAELKVVQPHYIDSFVDESNGENYTVYTARGRVLELVPQNFNASDVVDVEIRESAGSIGYKPDRGIFELDTKGKSGTYTIHFTVQETVRENVVEDNTTKTVTKTVTRTYGARVKVSKTNLAHVSKSSLESQKSDAENWSEVEALYGNAGDPNKPIEKKLQFGAKLVSAAHNPLAAIQGDFGMAVQVLFTTAGGLILFALLMVPIAIRNRRLRRQNKDLKDKIGDYEEISDALDDIFSEQRKQWIKEKSFNDWFDDRTAAWYRRNVAPDPWGAIKKITAMLSPGHLKGIVASAMLDSDRHVAVVERRPVADGGDQDDDLGDVVGARMVDRSRVDADADVRETADGLAPVHDRVEIVESSDELTHEITRHFDAATLESDVLRESDVDLTSVALPIGNMPEDDDFIRELNVKIPDDFETREHFADTLATLVEKVAASHYSTDDGAIDPQRDLANMLLAWSEIGGEAYEMPYLRYVRDLMLHNKDRLNSSKRVENVVEDARDNRELEGGSPS